MLFVGTILTAVGYTMLFAAVKGDSYRVGGVPVWRRPWLPFVDIFTGHALTGGAGPSTDDSPPGAALTAAMAAQPSSVPPAATAGGGIGPVTQVPPGTIVT